MAKLDLMGKIEAIPTAKTSPAAAPAKAAKPVRVNPVRLNVNLAPQTHAWLKSQTMAYAADLQVTRVTSSDVIRALIEVLQEDPAMQAKVKDLLADSIAE